MPLTLINYYKPSLESLDGFMCKKEYIFCLKEGISNKITGFCLLLLVILYQIGLCAIIGMCFQQFICPFRSLIKAHHLLKNGFLAGEDDFSAILFGNESDSFANQNDIKIISYQACSDTMFIVDYNNILQTTKLDSEGKYRICISRVD